MFSQSVIDAQRWALICAINQESPKGISFLLVCGADTQRFREGLCKFGAAYNVQIQPVVYF